MADSFIPSVASDLAASLLGRVIEILGGPSLEKIREELFWNRLMTRFVSRLCTGYEAFERAEREQLLAIDEDFFQDPVVRTMFTERIVVGDVDRDQLRDRFIALYGDSQVELFERNLEDALALFQNELNEALSPPERAAFAELGRRLDERAAALDERLKQGTQAVLAGQSQTDRLIIESRDQIRGDISSLLPTSSIDEVLSSEYQTQLDQARDWLQAFQPRRALDYLSSLKDRIWDKASPEDRFRLLTNIGFAHYQLNNHSEAAQLFIDALNFNPDNAKALCNAALGYLIQGEKERCEELARQALRVDPTQVQAYSMLVQASLEADTFEAILAKVPEAYRNNTEVAMALGMAAGRRDLLVEAENWFRTAVECDTQDHPDPRGALASLLLDKVTRQYPIFATRGIITPDEGLVTEALELYNFAWDHVRETEIKPFRLTWLVNRATAKALLDDVQGAIQDVDEALRSDPTNPEIVRHRALLALRSRDLRKVEDLLRQALEIKESPNAKFWLAVALFESGKLNEAAALAQELFEQPELAPVAYLDVAHLLVSVKLEAGDLPEAEKIVTSVKESFPDNPAVLALRSRVARYEGQSAEADTLLSEAQNKVSSDTNQVDRYRLIEELYENEKFEAAASLLEEIVDIQVDSAPTRQLLNCYYRSGSLGPALDICKTLRENFGPLRFITEMESAIYEEIGDLSSARQVCYEYLDVFPDDLSVRLRLAVVNYRLKEFENLDSFLSQDIDLHELSPEGYIQLANLYLARNRGREALEIAYEARRHFFDRSEVHLNYAQIFIQLVNEDWLKAHSVDIDTAACIEGPAGEHRRWVIIEDRDDVDVERGELKPSHPLVQELLDKTIGDSVRLSHGFYEEEIVIREIKNKFVYAWHEILEAYQLHFPEEPGIWRIPVQLPRDDNGSLKGLQPIFDMTDRRQEYVNQAEHLYQQGRLTIGALAGILGYNPIEVRAHLTTRPVLGVRCCSGAGAERDEAIALMTSNPKLVADVVSLMTVYQLEIGDAIVEAYGKPGIVRSTLEVIEHLLEDRLKHRSEEYWTIGKEGDQYIRQLVSVEEIEHNRQVLESILACAEAHCEILPCTAALSVKRDVRAKLGDLIGPSFVETVLVAADEGRILYSDDALFRGLAKAEYSVSGVWSQVVLMSLQKNGVISDEVYAQRVVRLACLNYYHTSINDQILLEATRQAQWRPNYPFVLVVSLLGGTQSDLNSAATVAAKYVRLLWKQTILPSQYEHLVLAVLDALASNRGNRRQVLAAFEREIEREFALVPTEEAHIKDIMKTWTSIHTL